ncbi:MAG: amidase [Hyphomonadaceae bacterium]|nr:amidase [Hyphomonadaceae bacterium]
MTEGISRREAVGAVAAAGLTAACQPGEQAAQSDALGALDGVGVAAAIRAGDITAQEALDAAIARSERVNGELNFVAAQTYDFARTRAAGALSGPFAGVPTLIKDLMPVTGLPTHYGCRAFANNVADAQPPFMDALLAAGLAPFGKSTTPEFGLTATTEPLLGGPTKNPWDITRSCGGSSGGAAVAVAARVIPVAHASDGGGSIRIPASCNGVFGLKPSRNRTLMARDDDGPLPISVNNCVSRSVRDSAAWFAVVEQSGDGAAFPPVGVVEGPSTQRLRIALNIPDFRGREPDPEVRAAIEAAATLCRGLGHDVREARPEFDGETFSRDFILLWAAGAAQVVQLVQANAGATPLDQLLEPLTLDLARHYQEQGPNALAAGVRRLREVEARYAAFFADVDVLLTPVLSKPPPPLGEISPTLGMAEGFARVIDYVGYTPLQNVAGAPAMSVPLAWSQAGLPIGAHFSAAPGQERRLLELAFELEQAQPWASRAPGVSAA